jgi:membrane associated rhomboid family serine protease
MIPIKDDNPSYSFPFMTIFIIVINVAVQIYQWTLGSGGEAFIFRFGAIPWEITHFQELPELSWTHQSRFPSVITLLTSIFIHGGFFHLAGNMLYLWIFGDNVESLMGHMRFFFFFILCGIIASFTHIIIDPNSKIPMIGASGAISGVLGAYFVRFSRAKVHVLIFFFFFIRVIRVSALFALGFWFILQILSGLGTLGTKGGGVAWFAHIGGFVVGMFLIPFFEKKERIRIYRRALR